MKHKNPSVDKGSELTNMGKVHDQMRKAIRLEAERFLGEYDFSAPPLSPEKALAARKLVVTQYSLDDLLVEANLSLEDHKKIQAMLDQTEKAVTFRNGLAEPQRKWGTLHEIGHDYLPWQRELLYYCPLISMPVNIQKDFEVEADIFAAETFFFGSKFNDFINEGDRNLKAAIDLADNLFGTSRHATIRHYVEASDTQCCLIVWQPKDHSGELSERKPLVVRYYIKSNSFVNEIFNDPSISGVVDHEMTFIAKSGKLSVANAQSFSNSYSVFTLIDQPVEKSSYVAGSTK